MRKLLASTFSLLALNACAGSIDDADQPLDPEFGTIEWERADDNSVVRPNTPEGDAVLAYANQAIASDVAGRAFLTELDGELNVLAARAIVEARSGADGTFGTADDVTFTDLGELDEVRYVGRTALMQLFVLAEANGYFQTTSSCEEVLGSRGGSTVEVTTMAELIEIENSRCDRFTGSLRLDISANVLPAHRGLKALDHVRRIEGELTLGRNAGLNSLTFRGLTHLGRINSQDSSSLRGKASFPALTTAGRVTNLLDWSMESLEEVDTLLTYNYSGTFPALRTVKLLEPSAHNVRGFNALEEAGTINVDASGSTDGFASLRKVDRFLTNSPVFSGLPALEEAGRILVLGGSAAIFPRLRKVGSISTRGDFSGDFPVLESAEKVDMWVDSYPFPALTEVSGNFRLFGKSAALSASVLKTVGGAFTSTTSFSDFAALEEVGGSLTVEHDTAAWNGLNALEQVGGDAFVTVNNGNLQGLGKLQSLPNQLKVEIARQGTFDALHSLEVTGGLFFADLSDSNRATYLPALVLVDGPVRIEGSGSNSVRGLEALDSVNGDFSVYYMAGFAGVSALESVGGSTIVLPRNMPGSERDRFLSQLQQFSGNIEYR